MHTARRLSRLEQSRNGPSSLSGSLSRLRCLPITPVVTACSGISYWLTRSTVIPSASYGTISRLKRWQVVIKSPVFYDRLWRCCVSEVGTSTGANFVCVCACVCACVLALANYVDGSLLDRLESSHPKRFMVLVPQYLVTATLN